MQKKRQEQPKQVSQTVVQSKPVESKPVEPHKPKEPVETKFKESTESEEQKYLRLWRESREQLHRQVQAKLTRKTGDYWSMINESDFSEVEREHLHSCTTCQELWGLRRSQKLEGFDIYPTEHKSDSKDNLQEETDRKFREAMRDEGLGHYL